jgi:DNA-binding PadR family transcriptional regulator
MATDVLRGHLDGLLLSVLADGPRHGYAVIELLRTRSAGVLDLPTGTVYPALRRLERQGWADCDWDEPDGLRRRRTYRITEAGHRHLRERRVEWRVFSAAIERVLIAGSGSPVLPMG